uniref:Uncharacterized protein n=1 Tax=Knipowitschia caucasica TaxID=637954 RepID=A0AAV2J154_KNICA
MSYPLPCAPGWSSTAGQIKCHLCNDSSPICRGAASRWSPSVLRSSPPAACRPGTYRDPQEEADCVLCPKGFYCLEGGSQRPTSQFLCPQGYYCEEGTATPHGSPCPAGTAGEQLGQTSRAACKRCREGRFCPAGSAGPGLPCARGRYCPAGTLEEIICPHGTFTPHQGAISIKDCLKCPAGFYCPAGTSDPVPCPSGSFNPLEGQGELHDCRACYAGKACTQVALKAPDVDCMQGYVCPPGSSKPNSQNNACPPGTLSNRTDLTDRSQCQRCPARYACPRGTGGIQRPPVSCFAGHYCPSGTMFPTQHKCPVGTWSGQSGLEYESECQPCPRGWYCLAGSAAPTGRCSSGHYCPEGTAYGSQFPCPVGTYSIQMGNRHIDDCVICPEGFFCPEGTSKPSPCPRATYQPHKGGQKQDECLVCPAGYFCPHSATVNPRVCGVGSYSDEGSVECSACLRGHFCSNETTSEEAMLKVMVCPAGFLCSQDITVKDKEHTHRQYVLRAFTVQWALLFLSLVLREPSAPAQLLAIGLSAPLVVEESFAMVLVSKNPQDNVKSATTVKKEPSRHDFWWGMSHGLLLPSSAPLAHPLPFSALMGLSLTQQEQDSVRTVPWGPTASQGMESSCVQPDTIVLVEGLRVSYHALLAQKEAPVLQHIFALREVPTLSPAQLEASPISQGVRCVPAVQLVSTVQR